MLYLKPPPGLTVLYLPLAAVIERWRITPLVHKSSIIATTDKEQKDGLPPFIVTGTCLDQQDIREARAQLKVMLSAVFTAIEELLSRTPERRQGILGFWAYDLTRGVTVGELHNVMCEVGFIHD